MVPAPGDARHITAATPEEQRTARTRSEHRVVDPAGHTPGGAEAAMIGEIRDEPAGAVLSVSRYGGTRIIDMLVGDPLPRIC